MTYVSRTDGCDVAATGVVSGVTAERSTRMSDHTYRVTEIVGTSHEGV